MAIWQYQVVFIPRDSPELMGILSDDDPRLRKYFDDGGLSWNFRNLTIKNLAGILSIAFAQEKWCDSIFRHGESDGDRLSVYIDEGGITEGIEADIDARGSYMIYCQKLITWASILNAIFLVQPGIVIEPSMDILVEKIRNSSAWLYPRDPLRALRSMKKVDNDNDGK
jgi:hypothetical protein